MLLQNVDCCLRKCNTVAVVVRYWRQFSCNRGQQARAGLEIKLALFMRFGTLLITKAKQDKTISLF